MRAPSLPGLAAALCLWVFAGAATAPLAGAQGQADDEDLDAVLEGFDGSTASEPALDEILEGFDAADTTGSQPPEEGTGEDGSESAPSVEQLLELTGDVGLGAAYNLYPHSSSIGPPPSPRAGTYYGNLQRLRVRGGLQLDGRLPYRWKLRAQAYALYDFAYVMHGFEKYTQEVRDDYEIDAEVQDLWVAGRLLENLDLKLGRQVINWGRSDTLRVNDVLNPLNNREPGLADIEDLRLPVTAARADLYLGHWSFTALVIPEIRFDYIPPPGSDFYPALDLGGLPPVPGFDPARLAPLLAGVSSLPVDRVDPWGSTPEYGGAIQGIFSGWDVAFYAARIYQNQTSVNAVVPDFRALAFHEDRVTHVGTGGNYTVGSWLFKAELAYVDELDYLVAVPDTSVPVLPYRLEHRTSSRLDFMGGVEYYGFTETNIALEVVNRHLFDYDPLLAYLPNYLEENNVEMALRMSRDLMNSRLHLNGVGVVLGERAQRGATIRLWVDYDLVDALVVTAGYLVFVAGDVPPLDAWDRNDRLFFNVKYSF